MFASCALHVHLPFAQNEHEYNPDSVWVVKEDRGQQGQGLHLTFDVPLDSFSSTTKCLAQQYIDPPALIEGRRFDLRVYVFVTSYEPLRVFMAKDGAVHLCSDPYTSPRRGADMGPLYRHVTNVAVNQKAPGYSTGNKDGKTGNIRSFANFAHHFPGGDDEIEEWWRQVKLSILKVLAAVKPFVDEAGKGVAAANAAKRGGQNAKRNIRCFELYGVDVIASADMKPYILEFNQFPSWVVSGSWFGGIKTRLLRDIIGLTSVMQRVRNPFSASTYNTAGNTEDASVQSSPSVSPEPSAGPDTLSFDDFSPSPGDASLAKAEDAVLSKEGALLERVWPLSSTAVRAKSSAGAGRKAATTTKKPKKGASDVCDVSYIRGGNAKGSWASENDVAAVHRALSVSREMFSGFAKTLGRTTTASLSHGDPVANLDYEAWAAADSQASPDKAATPAWQQAAHTPPTPLEPCAQSCPLPPSLPAETTMSPLSQTAPRVAQQESLANVYASE